LNIRLLILLVFSSFLFSKEPTQYKNLLEKQVYFDTKISITEYSNKKINFSVKLLSLSNPWAQYLRWKETIIPVDVPIELGSYLYFKNQDESYIFNLYEYGEEVFQLKNEKINILGYIEDAYNYTRSKGIRYDRNDPFDLNIKFQNNQPLFFYKNRKNKIKISLKKSYKIKWKLNKQVQEYFDNFEKYGTPYGKNYLSQKEAQKIRKSNKSYQVYQELNKYDIFLMLLISSKNLQVYKKSTDLKYFHLIEEGMEGGIISSMIYVDKEGRGFSSDEPASLGIVGGFHYNIKTKKLIETITDDKDRRNQTYNRVWADIMDIYLSNKKREYLFIKKKSTLYKKPNLKSKSKKFLIKNDCAMIIDRTNDGWYKVFYYHPYWHTNTIMWIKFDAEKQGLIK